MVHTTFAATWLDATIARVSPAIVAVVLAAASFGLATAWMALAAKKVSFIAAWIFLASAKVLE